VPMRSDPDTCAEIEFRYKLAVCGSCARLDPVHGDGLHRVTLQKSLLSVPTVIPNPGLVLRRIVS
jgi:hypothetical protein